MRQAKLHDPRLFWRDDVRFIQACVRGGDGKITRRSTKCVDERAAVEWVNEQERVSANPRYRDASKATLLPAIEAGLAELQRRKRAAGTLSKFAAKSGHFIRLWGEDMRLASINAKRVEDYIADREGEGVKPVTVHAELQALTLILKVAAHHGLFATPLVEVMPILYSSQHKPRTRFLTGLEFDMLLTALPVHRAAHLQFIVTTGARLAESQRAQAVDVDWTRKVTHIRGTKTAGSDADVPIVDVMVGRLKWAIAHAPNKYEAPKTGPMFKPWGKIQRDLAAACERAGIARCSPNDLRRTFGAWLVESGMILERVAGMLRHTTTKLAESTYARLRGERLSKLLAKKIDEVTDDRE